MVGHPAHGPDGPAVLGWEGAGVRDGEVSSGQTSGRECRSPGEVLAGQAQPGLETKTSVQMKSPSIPKRWCPGKLGTESGKTRAPWGRLLSLGTQRSRQTEFHAAFSSQAGPRVFPGTTPRRQFPLYPCMSHVYAHSQDRLHVPGSSEVVHWSVLPPLPGEQSTPVLRGVLLLLTPTTPAGSGSSHPTSSSPSLAPGSSGLCPSRLSHHPPAD